MAIQALVQARASAASSSSNQVLAFSSPVSQGDLLVAAVAWTSISGQPTLSDTQSNAWVEVGSVSSFLNGSMVSLSVFWTLASATGACTVTANVGAITNPTGVWLIIGEFTGANNLAIISGSALGFGVNPPYDGSMLNSKIQAVNPPLTTPTNSLMIAVATTSAGTATWSVSTENNWYTIAAQAGGIVLAFATNLYANAPFCDQTPPRPALNRSGDSSTQWVMITAPFTTTAVPPELSNTNVPSVGPNFQYPHYPYDQA